MTIKQAIDQEWKLHYEDMRRQRDKLADFMMMHVVELLEVATEVFPLSTMGPNFSGAHSLTLGKDRSCVLSVWYDGLCYPVSITTEEPLLHLHEKRAMLEDVKKQIIEALAKSS